MADGVYTKIDLSPPACVIRARVNCTRGKGIGREGLAVFMRCVFELTNQIAHFANTSSAYNTIMNLSVHA